MVDLVQSKLEEAKGDIVVILQLFDNGFFLAQTEDGGLLPAVREPVGGKFHVHGDLVFAPKELQYSLFNSGPGEPSPQDHRQSHPEISARQVLLGH